MNVLLTSFIWVVFVKTVASETKLANISYLLYEVEKFNVLDVDEDGFMELDDARVLFLRHDVNGDGVMSTEEESSVSDRVGFLLRNWPDLNGDGRITIADHETFFSLTARKYGNDISLEEFIDFKVSRAQREETGITVESFIHARKDFKVTDMDNDDEVSKKEFKSEFLVADFNKDKKLSTDELPGFRPICDIDVAGYCSNTTVGCLLTELMALFNDADVDKNAILNLEEYVKKFGKMIDNSKPTK